VAHNAPFDTTFLSSELKRAGYALPSSRVPALCTLRFSKDFVHTTSRRLADCCKALDIVVEDSHEALADARAVAGLFEAYAAAATPPPPWHGTDLKARSFAWPMWSGEIPVVSFKPRSRHAPRRPTTWLDRIVSGLPRSDDAAVDAYLCVLETAMLDRHLSKDEQDCLVELAHHLGMDRERVGAVHREYLGRLAVAALSDGVVTKDERDDLAQVAELLVLADDTVHEALRDARVTTVVPAGFRLRSGDSVCLSGHLTHPHATIAAILGASGVRVDDFGRETKLVVASDSAAPVVAAARAAGVPVVSEDAFWGLLLSFPSPTEAPAPER
jgi:DNA polymerase-3 subunit epsilon